MASGEGTIVLLKVQTDWPRWLAVIQTKANHNHVWPYIKPTLDDHEVRQDAVETGDVEQGHGGEPDLVVGRDVPRDDGVEGVHHQVEVAEDGTLGPSGRARGVHDEGRRRFRDVEVDGIHCRRRQRNSPFLRNTTDNGERDSRTPERRSISSLNRGSVQFGTR